MARLKPKRITFTAKSLTALKPSSDRVEYWDESTPGFGIRVTANGKKTFIVLYRHASRLRRFTIGTFPPLTLADARDKAKDILRSAEKGSDPQQEKIEIRAAGTFGELADLYMEKHSKPNKAPKTSSEDQRQLDAYVLPLWKHIKASAISIDDVEILLERLAERGPTQANRTRALIRHIFQWATTKRQYRRQFALHTNPAALTEKAQESGSRERVYTDRELCALWNAFGQIGAVGELFKLQLLTEARPGEVAQVEWNEIELDRGIWTQPSTKTKNDKVHVIPLAPLAVAILEHRRNEKRRPSPYVFYNPRNPAKPLAWVTKASVRVRELSGVKDFRPHDLRRTVATRLAQMGVSTDVLKLILNHSLGNDVTAIYNRYLYFEERKTALEKWATELLRVVSAQPVVESTPEPRSPDTPPDPLIEERA